ncbi:unnamed protein product [Rotaria sp. Silwood2]|nr:unnamed protein product [Rotaria sp. Silwood2]CAF4292683.1 unnamed protein product [Rotaria sp. Silwood2]
MFSLYSKSKANQLNVTTYGNSTLASYGAMVGIASSNVSAYSNGNDSYISNESNYLYNIYTGMRWQCVEYARRWLFIRKGCVFDDVDAANDMWSQLSYVQRVVDGKCFSLKKYQNGSTSPPKNESLLIYRLGKDIPYGHVSVIVDVLNDSIRVAEQNFHAYYWASNYSRQIPYVLKNGSYYIMDSYNIYGWMSVEDNNENNPLNQSTIDKIIQKNISFPDFVCSKSITHNYFSLYYYLVFFFLLHLITFSFVFSVI